MQVTDLPIARRSRHLAEVRPFYRRTCLPTTQIETTEEAVDLLRKLWSDEMDFREEVYILLLDNDMNAFGWAGLFKGTNKGCDIDPAIIMQLVLITNASYFMVAHNHPSGNLTVSAADRNVANKLYRMGEDHQRQMVDFLILTSEDYQRVLYSED